MNLLSHHGLHDIDDERWNAYGQFTYISSWKPPFTAPYTNANGSTNSLCPSAERSYTRHASRSSSASGSGPAARSTSSRR